MPSRPEKSPIRLVRFGDIQFGPRFEHGDMARIAEVCGENDGTELGVGWARLTGARIPWTIRYDEVLTVFEGQLQLHADGRLYSLEARDSIWLPAGTELVYEADYALIHFAIHPSSWASGSGAAEQ
ncbi:MAG: ethanolamine utilization protein EutQ [Gammaproteobacteria bacterium]|nr:ethanolamine utilization protein EutQ [Gammaproteobacteria bacterium]MYD77058.1 ethanolamine utilization protein EutQ [Gammaproteobacteria bacterium]MYJ53105.1 ethanolamine utilization protein EutQ [Gammaproteobacteria bacterium]